MRDPARERLMRLRGLRVVPDDPDPAEFPPGPVVPPLYRLALRRLADLYRRARSCRPLRS